MRAYRSSELYRAGRVCVWPASTVICESLHVRAVSINSLPSQRSYLLTYPNVGTLTVSIMGFFGSSAFCQKSIKT
ncbi:hypothetical protein J6590_089430 [Homalodisca vitripennis]|nr:hypothetical protein J6590_089430 [Homalodisca vitripennis]